MRKLYHFWYSEKQAEIINQVNPIESKSPNHNTVVIDGKRVAYTECSSNKKRGPMNFKDAIYLGKVNFWESTQHHTPDWHRYIPKKPTQPESPQ